MRHDIVFPLPLLTKPLKPFIAFRKVLSVAECRDLIRRHKGKTQQLGHGTTESSTGDAYPHPVLVRQSALLVRSHRDLYGRVAELFAEANEHYQFSLAGMYEQARFCEYHAGHFSGTHADYDEGDRSKLTMTLKLNDNYQGGAFRLTNSLTPRLAVGDAVVFPSYAPHEVAECVSGIRFVVVAWAAGPRFT